MKELSDTFYQTLRDLQKINHALSNAIFETAGEYATNEGAQDLLYAKEELLPILAKYFGVTYKEIFDE